MASLGTFEGFRGFYLAPRLNKKTLFYTESFLSSELVFELEHRCKDSKARAGRILSKKGVVPTPIFMPVGTQATVRGVDTPFLDALGSRILLANTYHLLLRPGPEVFRKFGGIHAFMQWPNLILTDSGGFQIFSLPNERRITEESAEFKSYIDGSKILLSPELSISTQEAIGSDIMMVLDECVPATASLEEARRAMNLTHRWARRSLAARSPGSEQALFAIVQGGCHESLRLESAQTLQDMSFDGYAIGGLAVGETREERKHFTQFAANLLPENKARYLMGVGTPVDLLEAIHRGVDMFDCILPSALAQQGTALTWKGWLKLRRAPYKFDTGPLDKDCQCFTCSQYSRGYLHHLVKANEGYGWRLIAHHNFYFYHHLVSQFRKDILEDTFESHYKERQESLAQIDVDYPAQKQASPKTKDKNSLGQYGLSFRKHDKETWVAISHHESKEIMHPSAHPDTEARTLYVDTIGLSDLLTQSNCSPFVVWDVGLGAAHNAMAVINLLDQLKEKGIQHPETHLLSFENDLDSLRLALMHKKHFAHLRHPGPHQLLAKTSFCKASYKWSLLEGPFADNFLKADLPDVVLFDPFSYKTNPECWSLGLFRSLHKYCLPKMTTLVTYSSATRIRASLLIAGWFVYSCPGVGTRSEASLAFSMMPADDHPAIKTAQRLGRSWLERWERSCSPLPDSLSSEEKKEFSEKVRNHPQFA